jgi:hypothetical protein
VSSEKKTTKANARDFDANNDGMIDPGPYGRGQSVSVEHAEVNTENVIRGRRPKKLVTQQLKRLR